MIRALLIDDEPPACDILRTLLAEHPQVSIAGEAGTLDEACARLATHDYDLVFLDIQLRGGTGFDLVPRVRPGAKIIFVTAYDRHALRAFEVNALDYLLKPVAPERLAAALARHPASERPPAAPLAMDDRLLLKLGAGSERFVCLRDIRLIESEENYSRLIIGADGEHLLVRKTMKAWEDLLPTRDFLRVHRQTIVNLTHVCALERAADTTSHLRLDGLAAPIIVSHRHAVALRKRLASLRPR